MQRSVPSLLRFGILVCAVALATSSCMRAAVPGGEELAWKSFADARSAAKESKRKVIVDVWTSWCGWCKKMDRDVYSNADVRAYLDAHFEIAKLDAEASAKQKLDEGEFSGRDIAKSMGVSSYPTTVFFTDTGDMITSVPGYIDAPTFLRVLEYIHGEFYKSQSWNDFLSAKGK
jgi:thioredoxin-related protein